MNFYNDAETPSNVTFKFEFIRTKLIIFVAIMNGIDAKLAVQAICKYIMGLLLVGVLLFLPAGAVMLAYIPIINSRIRNEEEVLTEGLKGYKVIPFIW